MIAEYNRLRATGSLQEEAYTRLVQAAQAENAGYAEGIQAVGAAIEGGIQGATSFSDALIKIGLSLAEAAPLQAAPASATRPAAARWARSSAAPHRSGEEA